MKLTFSPLVAGMSGKAAHAVAASWKGVPYVRKLVTPHNPKSADQVTQRGFMSRMSPWFRSLPTDVKTWLDDLAVGLGKSGANLMVAEDLKHLADAEDLEIVPANPECNALFSITAATGAAAGVKFTWDAGNAIQTHYVHCFTCPVDPAESGKEEPDGWTHHSSKFVLVSGGTTVDLPTLNTEKAYHVVGIVGDTTDIATCTLISGGIADHADSHA